MPELLFVYGTLRSNFENPHARLLRERAQLLGPATVPGSIYRIGDYPGYRPEPAGLVHGELFRLADPRLVTRLDDYEGPDFARISISATLANGVIHTAWIYRYEAAPPPDSLIASGDFCA